MRPYELVFILRPDLEEDAVQATIDRMAQIVEQGGGQVENIDRWGKRRLAYEIQGYREGNYTVLQFQSDQSVTTELERVLQLSEDVVRYLTVRRDEAD